MVTNQKLLNNMLSARTEFGIAKQKYKDVIYQFLGDAVSHIHIKFHGNKMYLTFESFCSFDDKGTALRKCLFSRNRSRRSVINHSFLSCCV